jgi:glycerol-3-phosphate O-acyltransferase
MSFGEPMDVMGNKIDFNGNTEDRLKEYFTRDAKVDSDSQREAVYTRLLAKKIVENYLKYNVVLTSHVVAFAGFEVLKKLHPDLDIFGLIRQPEEDFVFHRKLLLDTVEQLLAVLRDMEQKGEVRLTDQVSKGDTETVLLEGMNNLGVYHNAKPLYLTKKGEIESQGFKLLYYYHNRLEHYNLDKHIHWKQDLVNEAFEQHRW